MDGWNILRISPTIDSPSFQVRIAALGFSHGCLRNRLDANRATHLDYVHSIRTFSDSLSQPISTMLLPPPPFDQIAHPKPRSSSDPPVCWRRRAPKCEGIIRHDTHLWSRPRGPALSVRANANTGTRYQHRCQQKGLELRTRVIAKFALCMSSNRLMLWKRLSRRQQHTSSVNGRHTVSSTSTTAHSCSSC